MFCEIMVYSSLSLNYAKLFIFLIINIVYFFRHIIFKWMVLLLFKRIKYGNVSFIERSAVLKSDYTLEQIDKQVLNVVNNPKDPCAILYITNEKFYENFLFYGEKGLSESFDIDFHTENLYELFEIIYAPPTQEWIIYKKFIDAYNIKKPSNTAISTLVYKGEEFLFHVDEKIELSEEIKIVIHNGNFDFKNTSIESFPKTILTDKEISKKFIFERLERVSPDVYPEVDNIYYSTFLKFLFQKNYLSYNYYFCKK